jgi:hypothetical protein
MAIGLSIRFANGTQAQYEAMNAEMGVEADPPAGLIFHAAGPIDDGWGILDFWESREAFDTFQQSRLGPAVEAIGDQGPPEPPTIMEFPVYNTIGS